MIHIRRDPIDTCVSCFSTLFTDELPEGTILEVDYGDLVTNLEEQTRRILVHCGLDWDPACLAFHRTKRVVRTASAIQVRQPLYGTSIGRAHCYGPLLDSLRNGLGLPPAT